METRTLPDKPLPFNKAARCLCVPATWMRDQVNAGRLPALRAGRAILIHVPTVARLLVQRAQLAGHEEVAHG
ncbi:MAG TPA: hypothetical protein P5316_13665 [Phycisphaerae bacterium]|nr:hypothetical protein [Phycisphaerae bacterium]